MAKPKKRASRRRRRRTRRRPRTVSGRIKREYRGAKKSVGRTIRRLKREL